MIISNSIMVNKNVCVHCNKTIFYDEYEDVWSTSMIWYDIVCRETDSSRHQPKDI